MIGASLPQGLPGADTSAVTDPRSASHPNSAQAAEAARQFEGLLIFELMKVLRSTAPSGGLLGGDDFAGQMHTQMFDQALSESLATRGIGMQSALARQLGGEGSSAASTLGTLHRPTFDGSSLAMGRDLESAREGRVGMHGMIALSRAAHEMLSEPDAARRWSRDGTLGTEDLASDFETTQGETRSHFNVEDANGYTGYYKCNLFAFELARRAGYEVPLIGRGQGWGYPGPTGVTNDAADGRMRGDWSRVVTGASAESLDRAIIQDGRTFMLTGSGIGDRHGHMAMVERVHDIDYDAEGNVRRIVFDSWETRPQSGAQHMLRRTWNIEGNPGGHTPREGFGSIEILELQRAAPGAAGERPISGQGGASIRDGRIPSSDDANRPNALPRSSR